jgi:RNA polymerase-binding transcription factor DksA
MPGIGGTMNKAIARKLLLQERERLERLRSGVYHELGDASLREVLGDKSGADQHPADAGTERFEREKSVSIVVNLDVEIHEVDSALHRLDEGSYGRCEICRRAIGDQRLRARPAARYCINDQATMERAVRSA